MRRAATYVISFLLVFSSYSFADETIDFIFPVPEPKNVTIVAGESVTWLGASSTHPLEEVASDTSDLPLSGGFSSTSSPFSFKFETPGTYYYRCSSHGVFSNGGQMRGRIIVQQAGQATAKPTAKATGTTGGGSCGSKPGKATLTEPLNEAAVVGERVSLDWDDLDCAVSYNVVVRMGTKAGAIIDKKTVRKSKYKTKKLEKGKIYFWSVKSCNEKGCKVSAAFSFSLS